MICENVILADSTGITLGSNPSIGDIYRLLAGGVKGIQHAAWIYHVPDLWEADHEAGEYACIIYNLFHAISKYHFCSECWCKKIAARGFEAADKKNVFSFCSFLHFCERYSFFFFAAVPYHMATGSQGSPPRHGSDRNRPAVLHRPW